MVFITQIFFFICVSNVCCPSIVLNVNSLWQYTTNARHLCYLSLFRIVKGLSKIQMCLKSTVNLCISLRHYHNKPTNYSAVLIQSERTKQ